MLTKLRVYFPTPWFIAYENMPNPFPHAWSDGRSAHYQASLSEEFDIDDGPQTFTMQDHFDWLKARELARRAKDVPPRSLWGNAQSKMQVPDDEELNFSDYHDPEFNHIHDLPKR